MSEGVSSRRGNFKWPALILFHWIEVCCQLRLRSSHEACNPNLTSYKIQQKSSYCVFHQIFSLSRQEVQAKTILETQKLQLLNEMANYKIDIAQRQQQKKQDEVSQWCSNFLARGPHLSFRNPSRATRICNLNKNYLKNSLKWLKC